MLGRTYSSIHGMCRTEKLDRLPAQPASMEVECCLKYSFTQCTTVLLANKFLFAGTLPASHHVPFGKDKNCICDILFYPDTVSVNNLFDNPFSDTSGYKYRYFNYVKYLRKLVNHQDTQNNPLQPS